MVMATTLMSLFLAASGELNQGLPLPPPNTSQEQVELQLRQDYDRMRSKLEERRNEALNVDGWRERTQRIREQQREQWGSGG